MDSFYFFLILGSVAVFLILNFDKQQRHKVKKVLNQTNNVEPLLMMQSLGNKLNKLNNALSQAEEAQHIEQQFHKSTADYKSGRINMQTYNKHVGELLRRVQAPK